MMLTDMAGATAARKAVVAAGGHDDLHSAAPTASHRILPASEAFVDIGGELDIATADPAISYVRQVIDRHRGPATVDLATLGFYDASGLGALVRMASHARQPGRPFPTSPALTSQDHASPLTASSSPTPPAALCGTLHRHRPSGRIMSCSHATAARHKPAAAVQADTDREGCGRNHGE